MVFVFPFCLLCFVIELPLAYVFMISPVETGCKDKEIVYHEKSFHLRRLNM